MKDYFNPNLEKSFEDFTKLMTLRKYLNIYLNNINFELIERGSGNMFQYYNNTFDIEFFKIHNSINVQLLTQKVLTNKYLINLWLENVPLIIHKINNYEFNLIFEVYQHLDDFIKQPSNNKLFDEINEFYNNKTCWKYIY